jgi:hypothetical protein
MAGNSAAVAEMEEAAALMRDAGLTVLASSGWKDRGRSSDVNYRYLIDHHTAATNDITDMLINGRSDLQGPLCNFELREYGDWNLIASGRANHAGEATVSSSESYGIEATGPQNYPDTYGPAAFPNNYESYAIGNACILAAMGVGVDRLLGHKEIAVPAGRKIDIYSDMDQMRKDSSGGVDMGMSGDDWSKMNDKFAKIDAHISEIYEALARGEIDNRIDTSGQHYKDSNRATFENENAHFKYLARGEAPDGTIDTSGQHYKDSHRGIYSLLLEIKKGLTGGGWASDESAKR